VGFGMLSEPVRRAALEQACDTGEAALSGKVMLGPGPALPT
jgi:CHASE1-domain containing sensor protein